jgi:hypothetical protein
MAARFGSVIFCFRNDDTETLTTKATQHAAVDTRQAAETTEQVLETKTFSSLPETVFWLPDCSPRLIWGETTCSPSTAVRQSTSGWYEITYTEPPPFQRGPPAFGRTKHAYWRLDLFLLSPRLSTAPSFKLSYKFRARPVNCKSRETGKTPRQTASPEA